MNGEWNGVGFFFTSWLLFSIKYQWNLKPLTYITGEKSWWNEGKKENRIFPLFHIQVITKKPYRFSVFFLAHKTGLIFVTLTPAMPLFSAAWYWLRVPARRRTQLGPWFSLSSCWPSSITYQRGTGGWRKQWTQSEIILAQLIMALPVVIL